MAYNEKQIKEIVKRRHPEYDTMDDHWTFLEQTYKGGREWFTHIFKYHKEGDKEYLDRRKRAYRFNHTREVVDLVDKYIFKGEVLRKDGDAPAQVKEFWKRATRTQEPIEALVRLISKKSSICGREYIVVDNNAPSANGESVVLTVEDAKKMDVRCYAYVIDPVDVLDMSFDEDGVLNWILIKESARDDKDPVESTGKVNPRWRLWTREAWFLFEAKQKGNKLSFSQIDEGEHTLGVVPVVIHNHIASDSLYSAPSLIDDIAYLDRAVANYLSNLDAIIQDQTFSQLAMPAQAQTPGSDTAETLQEMGTKRVFIYDGEGGAKPFYLSPDPKQAELIITAIKQIINEIYHTVGMSGERTKQDNAMGIDNSSGVAKAYDFDKVNALLASKAQSLRMTEARILELVMRWHGEVVDPVEMADLVSYPKTFDVRGLVDEFDIASQLLLIQAPDEVRRQQMATLIEKLFPVASDAQKAKFESELKDWPPDLMDMITGTLTPGKPGTLKDSKTVGQGSNQQGSKK